MKLFIFETEPYERDYLTKHLKALKPFFVQERLSQSNVGQYTSAGMVSVFINSNLHHEVLSSLPQLKHIAIRATGFDHVELIEAKRKGVVVSNVPAYGTTTVAEHAFALMLAVSRKIFQSHDRTEKLNFDFHGLTGFDLEGKTLGLIGFGKIGKHVAKIARGFGMKVIAFDSYQDSKAARELGVLFVPLSQLFKTSDVISFHTPYTKTTHHILNMRTVKTLKKGVVIVNTARGPLIDAAALLYGLEHGIVFGAGLDVLEGEQELKEEKELLHEPGRLKGYLAHMRNHLLVERDDVIITPHNAFNSREAIERILHTTVENIKAFTKGKPINTVT